MQKLFLIAGAVLGALAVALGAFGAHALSDMLEASGRTDTFETAVKYQFFHALALLLLGVLMFNIKNAWMNYAGYSWLGGVIIFSGALLLICFTGITKFGMVAPIGGLLLIAGWVLLAIGTAKGL